MIWRAESAARSRNQAESVAALMAVLGIRIVEVPATETLITGGSRAWRPAKVSASLSSRRANSDYVRVFIFML